LIQIGFEAEINSKRNGLSAAGKVTGEDDGGAEFSGGAGPGDGSSADQCARTDGERDAREHFPFTCAIDLRNLKHLNGLIGERINGGSQEEWSGNKDLSHHHSGSGERKRKIEITASAIGDKQRDTGGGGRKSDGQFQ